MIRTERSKKIYRDADFSMYLIKADDKMADLQNILDQGGIRNGKVRLSVPKFKVEHSAVLDSAESYGNCDRL